MKQYSYLLLLLLVIVACEAPKEKKVTDVVQLSQNVVGTYEASLPCSDCISIEYQLEILPDSSFVEHVTYLGKPDGVYEAHGTWTPGSDSILTLAPTKLGYKIKVNADGTLTIADATENHLEKEPSILHRIGSVSKTDQSVLLNDIWLLESINRKEITDGDYAREKPLLEFHKVDGKVMGTTGCNRLNGTYKTEGNMISFGPLMTTKIACPGKGEATFKAALAEVNSYKIKDLKLYLLSGSAEKLRFKKVD